MTEQNKMPTVQVTRTTVLLVCGTWFVVGIEFGFLLALVVVT